MFGSGANHGIYAQFMDQSALANSGHKVGLLRGAGTRMALWFYAMMQALRLRQALEATIHQQKFLELKLKDSAKAAVRDVKDEKFWKCIYIILRAVFPALRLLCYCDKNKPAMDKIFFLSHRTTVALDKSEALLNDKLLFGALKSDSNLRAEGDIVLGEVVDDDDSVLFEDTQDTLLSDDESDVFGIVDDSAGVDVEPDAPIETEKMSFGCQVIFHWSKRKKRIEHEYAIAGWALCVLPEVQDDVTDRMKGDERDAIEKVVMRLHAPPCPNPAVLLGMSSTQILDTFWSEFKAFRNHTKPYNDPRRWASHYVITGDSYLWHENYSYPYTKVLGYVACRVTSKLCGIGPAERSWGGVKQIKDGKRSHLSAESTEKRSILFVSSKIQQARMECDRKEAINAGAVQGGNKTIEEDDFNFDMQLEKFGVDTGGLKARVVERVFRAWVEDWEEEIRYRNDVVNETLLLEKYKGLRFRDPDTRKVFYIWNDNLEFHRGKGQGWHIIGIWADNPSTDEADEESEPFSLEIACELIGQHPQKDGIEVIRMDYGIENAEG